MFLIEQFNQVRTGPNSAPDSTQPVCTPMDVPRALAVLLCGPECGFPNAQCHTRVVAANLVGLREKRGGVVFGCGTLVAIPWFPFGEPRWVIQGMQSRQAACHSWRSMPDRTQDAFSEAAFHLLCSSWCPDLIELFNQVLISRHNTLGVLGLRGLQSTCIARRKTCSSHQNTHHRLSQPLLVLCKSQAGINLS